MQKQTNTLKTLIENIRKGYPDSIMQFEIADIFDTGNKNPDQRHWHGILGKLSGDAMKRYGATNTLEFSGLTVRVSKLDGQYIIEARPLLFVTPNRKDMADEELRSLRKFIKGYCHPAELSQWSRDIIVNTRHERSRFGKNKDLHTFVVSLTIPEQDAEDLNIEGIVESILFFKGPVIDYDGWSELAEVISKDSQGVPAVDSVQRISFQ